MVVINGKIFHNGEKKFICADMIVERGKISAIGENLRGEGEILDCAGKYVIPGLVDIHTHGAVGLDMINCTAEDFVTLSKYYAARGITTVFATTISAPHEKIMRMIAAVKAAKSKSMIDYAGIHVEGPYINSDKAGAHNRTCIRLPDISELDEIADATLNCGLKLHITLAPELKGAEEFMRHASNLGATISIGHTVADAGIIEMAKKNGAVSFTHLFNAMPQIHHRTVGTPVHALLDDDMYTEIICDGIHIAPELAALVSRAKGMGKIIIVSDSMAAAGLDEGEFSLETKRVTVKNGRAVITDTDTLAGSTANIFDELMNFMKFTNRGFDESIAAVTENPAQAVGLWGRKGALNFGFDADFCVLDENFKVESVIVMS